MGSDWLDCALGEFVRFQRGHDLTASEQLQGNVPIMGSAGPNGTHNTALASGPGVVVGRSGASAGRVHFSDVDYWPHNTCLYVTDFLGNSPKFAYYLLQTLDLAAFNSGSAQPSLNRNFLYSIPLKIPPRAEQESIVDVLQSLDYRITLLRKANATLEAIAQALFKSWFVDFDPVRAKMEGRAPAGMDEATAALFPDGFEESELGEVPRGWRVKRLGDAVHRITKGTTPTTLKRPFVDAGINFVKAESMTGDGGFIPEKFAFIDDETHELLRRSQLAKGDVLISIAGTIGRIAVMTEDYLPANTNQAVALIRPLEQIFPSGLIRRFLQRDDSQQLMGERVVQAVQANLSLGSLSDLKLVVPPETVVGQLYDLGLAQIDVKAAKTQQMIRTLATLRDTLLPRLISGQLRLLEAEAMLENV
ncbi:MAG: restriction endonuclease subunit S [Polaromonas sp.]